MLGEQKKSLIRYRWFVFGTLAAGVINGLLGAGGGVIMLYLVRAILNKKKDMESAEKDSLASVIAIILPVSVISSLSYAARGSFDLNEMKILLIPALFGGVIGAYLTDRLSAKLIRWIFALLLIVSGIRMVM